MAFVFMQLMPISSSLLPMRTAALLYSFIVLTVALFFSSKYLKKEKKYDKLREKLLLLSYQIKKIALDHKQNIRNNIWNNYLLDIDEYISWDYI